MMSIKLYLHITLALCAGVILGVIWKCASEDSMGYDQAFLVTIFFVIYMLLNNVFYNMKNDEKDQQSSH